MKGIGFKLVYIAVLIFAGVLYLSSSTLRTIFSMKSEAVYYERKLENIKNDTENLKRELKWSESEEGYVKYMVKDHLGLVEPGEKKLYIVDNAEKDAE